MHTATKTLSQTHIAIAVAVVIGAAGIAAALVPPLFNQEKKSDKITSLCGGYNQSVCLPCKESLVVNELRTCTCSRDDKWNGNACVAEKKEPAVIVDTTADQKFERGASQVLLGSFRLMLNMHENASYTIKLYGVAGMGGVLFTNVKIRDEEGLFVGSSEGILENGKLITIQALNQGAGAFVGNGKKYKIYADVLKEAALTRDTIYMAGDYNERIELEKFSIIEAQIGSNSIKAERGSEGVLETAIKQDDKSARTVLGTTTITLPRGTDSLQRVLFREGTLTTTAFSNVFNGFVLEAKVDGKTLSYSGTTYLDPKRGYIIFGDEAFGSAPVLKGLPSDTKILLSLSGYINNRENLPVSGKLFLTYIQADGEKKSYFNESANTPLALQEYSIKMAEKVAIPENQFIVQADMTTMQFSPIPVGTAAAKIGSFAITSSKQAPSSLKITLDGLTAGEKYKYQRLFENLVIKNETGRLVAARKNLEHQEIFILDDALAPNTTKRYTITADVLLTAPVIASRLDITAPQKVDLQKFTLEKKDIGGIIINERTECFVYETNPAKSENILWEKPSFARCAKDLDPKQWDVTAWKGYVKTSTTALKSDPEKCYDEYHSVYKGVTSLRPNYMAYTKIKTACK